jgi:hypothetical protein
VGQCQLVVSLRANNLCGVFEYIFNINLDEKYIYNRTEMVDVQTFQKLKKGYRQKSIICG